MRLLWVLCAVFLFLASPARSQGLCGGYADVALVLAIDESSSIDTAQQRLQRQGYEDAFRDPRVISAIMRAGCIVVTVVLWSTSARQEVVWMEIYDPVSAITFADAIEHMTPRESPEWPLGVSTGIGDAIRFSANLLYAVPVEAGKYIIDISGDGVNNVGEEPSTERNIANEFGVTINGLPLVHTFLEEEDVADEQLGTRRETRLVDLEAYYRFNVVGGPGSFLIVAADYPTFLEALVKKLSIELALAQ